MLVEIGKTYEYYHSAFEGQNQMYTEATKYWKVQWLLL